MESAGLCRFCGGRVTTRRSGLRYFDAANPGRGISLLLVDVAFEGRCDFAEENVRAAFDVSDCAELLAFAVEYKRRRIFFDVEFILQLVIRFLLRFGQWLFVRKI